MLQNYLTTAIRTLRRQGGYAAINVLGLSLGLAACLLIALFVADELAHDRQHPDLDGFYRLTNHVAASDDLVHIAITPAVYAPTLEAALPEVQDFVRLHPAMGQLLMRRGETRSFEERTVFADPSVLTLFSFPLRSGDPETALNEPFSVVLSPSLAAKYFGDEDPMGHTIRVDEAYEYTVTGVLREDPRRSHIDFAALFSMTTLGSLSGVSFYGASGQFFTSFHLAAGYSYVRLAPGADPSAVAARATEVIMSHIPAGGPQYRLELQPVSDIYLRSDVLYEMRALGSITYIQIFIAVALFMLGIACINYMNLATARSMRRSTEVGVRKVLGARRRELTGQFLAEAVLTSLLALAVAFTLAALAMPHFNAVTGRQMSAAVLGDPMVLGPALVAAILIGLLAGSYPALVLSSLRPLSMLRHGSAGSGGGAGVRRLLVVTQFAATIILLVGTATVHRQLKFIETKDVGFDREHLVHFGIPDQEMLQRIDLLKERFAEHPGVARVATTSSIPGRPTWRHDTRPEGRPDGERWLMAFYAVDHDFVETLGLELVDGRAFSHAFPSDSAEAFLLNETAVARLGWQQDAVGREFGWNTASGVRRGRVIGVVRDFNFESIRNAIEPTFFALERSAADNVAVRLRPGHEESALAHLEGIWQELLPVYPFEYAFLDETLGASYVAERRFGTVVGLFTLLTMLVAAVGLFGLAAYSAQQRTREIGVRKVLGAGTPVLVALISKDFLKLVGIAFVIAVPVAYFTMSRWLEGFAYRIDLGPAVFLAAGAAALILALLAVSGQALRAALADPVAAIRTE
jgi:putative ABC transport system permease protein